tara:strand:- start:1228 stop:1527 length:300 start_codon:yes stop_codon:yes gene_type:complete
MSFGPTSGKPTAALGEFIGKDIFVKNIAKTDITTAELTTMIQSLQLTTTVIAVKCAAAFASGTTDSVNVILEGVDVANDASDALGVTGAALSDAAGFEV